MSTFLCFQSTRLTGLAVSKTPHLDIIPVYDKLLKLMEKFPKDYAYRRETEKLVKDRLDIVKNVRAMCAAAITLIILHQVNIVYSS